MTNWSGRPQVLPILLMCQGIKARRDAMLIPSIASIEIAEDLTSSRQASKRQPRSIVISVPE
jgi:hypothetical protein